MSHRLRSATGGGGGVIGVANPDPTGRTRRKRRRRRGTSPNPRAQGVDITVGVRRAWPADTPPTPLISGNYSVPQDMRAPAPGVSGSREGVAARQGILSTVRATPRPADARTGWGSSMCPRGTEGRVTGSWGHRGGARARGPNWKSG